MRPTSPNATIALFAAALACAQAQAQAQTPGPGAADYARAEKVLDYNLKGKVRNARVEPHWLGDGRFWYRRDGEAGAEYVLVDPAKRSREPLFDPARLRPALAAVAPDAAPAPRSVRVDNGVLHADFAAGANALSCDLSAYRCEKAAVAVADPLWLPSPDGRRALLVREHNLWLRDLRSGAERQLTRDGVAHYGYGVLPDFALHAVPNQQGKWKSPPMTVNWSPDGKRVFGTRYDERRVEPYPMVAMAPEDGWKPKVYEIRLGLMGEAETARDEWYSIDVDAGKVRRIAIPTGWNHAIESDLLGWSPDASRAYVPIARYDRPARMRLIEVDLYNGQLRTLLEERSDTRIQLNDFLYSRPAVAVLRARNQIVWFSERDGWGHLYLYDLRDGRLIRQLTSGAWLVRDVIGVDEKRGELYFTAGGREPGDPYQRRLYRIALDGGEPTLLTPEAADHAIEAGASAILGSAAQTLMSPDGAYVVDSYSTLDIAPRTVLRSTRDGAVVLELERADDQAVRAAGWVPPQRLKFTAADGRSEIYATAYFPPEYSRETARPKQYPVIDAYYGGPQINNAPVGFVDATATTNPISRSALARLGFVTITIDARGTPGRSQAFHDVSFGAFADPQIDDHVAAIEQLAQRFPGIDTGRVGVYGHSFGGYTSTRAILYRPDFYKVAVSSAGAHNYQGMYGGGVNGLERLLAGPPDYGNGRRIKPTPGAVPDNYRALDNAALADKLQGKLMLVLGDLDENALPAVTLQLSSALIRANKDFDLLYLPNQNHELFRNDAYYTRRMWDYFVEHLGGSKPPAGYKLAPPPAKPTGQVF
ncbi:DPP IV N-terminal domain-containing protein [Lysobacter enzymogenes]|uniref:S9 family peptidase n=1 Tax=Lysobacter enzymogenes TaxID=69 RepID=UPI00384FE4CF